MQYIDKCHSFLQYSQRAEKWSLLPHHSLDLWRSQKAEEILAVYPIQASDSGFAKNIKHQQNRRWRQPPFWAPEGDQRYIFFNHAAWLGMTLRIRLLKPSQSPASLFIFSMVSCVFGSCVYQQLLRCLLPSITSKRTIRLNRELPGFEDLLLPFHKCGLQTQVHCGPEAISRLFPLSSLSYTR